jgi:hypothetical protein
VTTGTTSPDSEAYIELSPVNAYGLKSGSIVCSVIA